MLAGLSTGQPHRTGASPDTPRNVPHSTARPGGTHPSRALCRASLEVMPLLPRRCRHRLPDPTQVSDFGFVGRQLPVYLLSAAKDGGHARCWGAETGARGSFPVWPAQPSTQSNTSVEALIWFPRRPSSCCLAAAGARSLLQEYLYWRKARAFQHTPVQKKTSESQNTP